MKVCFNSTVDSEKNDADSLGLPGDRQVVLTGNFSLAAGTETRIGENLLVISDAGLAARYTENLQAHAEHSVRPASR